MSDRGRIVAHVLDKLGEGCYARVYKCLMGEDAVAVKCVKMSDGIPSPLEVSIMMSYTHPYINSCRDATCDKDYFYFIQDIAVSDLQEAIPKFTGSLEVLYNWCGQLIQAVSVLHRESIIHCDIKPSNVLLSSDGTIKLTDFSHSLIYFGCTYSHEVGTTSYKAPEVLSRQSWDEKIDIWSLGCTLYFIFAKTQLVPHQIRDKAAERALNSIREWKNSCGEIRSFSATVTFKPITMTSALQTIDINLRLTIESMLSYYPFNRTSIAEVMDSLGMIPDSYIIHTRGVIKPNDRAMDIISKMNINSFIADHALSIYSKVRDTVIGPELVKIETAVWIACKMITNSVPDIAILKSQVYQILNMEIAICEQLDYKLHV